MPTRPLRPFASPRRGLVLLAAALVATLVGCETPVEKAPPRPRPVRAERPPIEVEVPQMMRGTVASEAVVLGYRDVVVRGFGLVVGLRGTGTRVTPTDIRAFMVREMSRRGVGQGSSRELTPDELLESMDTTVVVIEGVIPAGSPAGTTFDVRVYVPPGTSTTSLEGGRLYTADLRPGQLSAGPRQASILATAKGPIFVNPFVEPRSGGSATRLSGRILDGGLSSRDMPLKLRLYTPSHNRAATIQSAINSYFPREPGQRGATARGESGEAVALVIPPSFRGETRDFIELLRHTPLSIDAPEALATQVRRALLAMPTESDAASWRWQALGVRVLPVIRDLYEFPEEGPRLAALRAGARLNDQQVVAELVEMAQEGSTTSRIEALELLGGMGFNPAIDLALREFLQAEDVDVRVTAFTELARRGDPVIGVLPVQKKFELIDGPCRVPTIYVTQSGKPRIVVGSNEPIAIDLPLTLTLWSGRLMLKGDHGSDTIEVFYRPDPERNDRIIADAPVGLLEFIEFLAHKPSAERPGAGLDMAYGEVVGVLYEMVRNGNLRVDFKSEQDRIMARILDLERDAEATERPEFGDPDFDFLEEDDGTMPPDGLDPLQESPLGPIRGGESSPGTRVPGTSGGIVPR